jgi:glycosyltransferase involved in cell wall biosynthesis
VPNAIGTGAALVVLLEPDAGVYSVPSKTLAYLCADRPLLGAIPLNNLAAKLITREGAGLVAAPEDEAGFVAAARRLRADPALRAEMAARGKSYADHAFDIDRITDQFERLLTEARDRARV